MALNTKTSLLHDIESIDSHQNLPKSFMGCIKGICDDWEAMVKLLCPLVLWIMVQKWNESSLILHGPQHKNRSLLHDIESIDSHQNHSKSFMGCIKSICDDWEAMVWLFNGVGRCSVYSFSAVSNQTLKKVQSTSWVDFIFNNFSWTSTHMNFF
jgi:hypothetical protein